MRESEQSANVTVQFRNTRYLNAALAGLSIRLIGAGFHQDNVKLTILGKDELVAEVTRYVDQEIISDLEGAAYDGDKLRTDDARNLLGEVGKATSQAMDKLLRVLKYYLDCPQLSETQISKMPRWEWSLDKEKWSNCPVFFRGGTPNVYITAAPTFDVRECTEKALASEPLFYAAMYHLHHAMRQTETRNKWIDTAIAVELAIKEFLARYEPKLQPLLAEVPSPPLRKLYGQLLEEYAGERSPYVSELEKGASKRNLLVHKPAEEIISAEEAEEYVKTAEVAILHLLTLLFPSDPVIAYQYKEKVGRLAK